MSARTLYRINVILVGLYIAWAVLVWPSLPERIPVHFDLAGRPDGWSGTSILRWFGLPFSALVNLAVVWGAGRLARRSPQHWNVPEKERFLALSPEAREPIVEMMDQFLARTSLLITWVFGALHVAVYTTALGRTTGMSWYIGTVIAAAVVGPTVGAIVLARRVGQMVREASSREEHLEGAAGTGR